MYHVDTPYQSNYDAPAPGRVGYTSSGVQHFTPYYMGGIHPRPKQTVGRRLALAARAVAYKDDTIVFTGPVLKNCSLGRVDAQCIGDKECTQNTRYGQFRQLTFNFDEELLKDDAVKVWHTAPDTTDLTLLAYWSCVNASCVAECNGNASCVVESSPGCREKSFMCQQGMPAQHIGPRGNGYNYNGNPHVVELTAKPISPLEIEVNSSLWLPVAINDQGPQDEFTPTHWNCQQDPHHPETPPCVNGSRNTNWATVTANIPAMLPLGCSGEPWEGGSGRCRWPRDLIHQPWCVNCTHSLVVTGVRYAWSEAPCCGGNSDRQVLPCPVNSCPISTFNSTLPAVPFNAKIVMDNDTASGQGKCECYAPQNCS